MSNEFPSEITCLICKFGLSIMVPIAQTNRQNNENMTNMIKYTKLSSRDVLYDAFEQNDEYAIRSLYLKYFPKLFFDDKVILSNKLIQKATVPMIDWCYNNKSLPIFSKNCIEHMAVIGRLDLLKMCQRYAIHYLQLESVFMFSAEHGHIDIVKFLRETIGCKWNEKICEAAALNGHIEVVKYCRLNGCPWDARTSANAQVGGHIELYEWCLRMACPWDYQVYEEVFKKYADSHTPKLTSIIVPLQTSNKRDIGILGPIRKIRKFN